MFSRNNRDITASYPDLARLPVADGLVLDEHGRPGFARLQQRMHVIRPSVALLAEVPVRYIVFDILRRAGRLLREEPFTIRRQILDDLRLDTAGLQVSPMSTYTPGELVMTAARQQGLEGVAAKARGRATSPAGGPGRGSRHRSGTPLEVIIAGWSPSTGHPNALGSLLLAAHHG